MSPPQMSSSYILESLVVVVGGVETMEKPVSRCAALKTPVDGLWKTGGFRGVFHTVWTAPRRRTAITSVYILAGEGFILPAGGALRGRNERANGAVFQISTRCGKGGLWKTKPVRARAFGPFPQIAHRVVHGFDAILARQVQRGAVTAVLRIERQEIRCGTARNPPGWWPCPRRRWASSASLTGS